MKDEFPGDIIICIYGTGAKAYYILSLNGELKKAKVITKDVVKRHLCGDDYRQIVENGGTIMRKMNTFNSTMHNIYTELKNKTALSHHDDKRFLTLNTVRITLGSRGYYFYQTYPELSVHHTVRALQSVYNNCSQSLDDSDDDLGKLISMMVAKLDE